MWKRRIPIVGSKACSVCKQMKDIETNFYKQSRKDRSWQGYNSQCKSCILLSKEQRKDSLAAHRREWELQTKYGLSVEEKKVMLLKQDGKCGNPRCRIPLTLFGIKRGDANVACVDHVHLTGEVRGILCNGCNTAIGNAKDSVDVLVGLSEYLNNFGGAKA